MAIILSSSHLCLGNYDEGFGREQHKTKWAGQSNDPAANTNRGATDEGCNGTEENGEHASPVINGEAREVTAEA